MKIVTLVENTSANEKCIAEHGLSVYIETEKHKLLLDTGQTDAVVRNAETLGIDLTEVDTVVLSHGHYDHSGGILPFSKLNRTAQIVMQRTATEPHYNGERYIGIDTDIIRLPNVRLIDGDVQLDDELFLFSGITGRRCYPQGNRKLSCIKEGEKVEDNFMHEQCLVITQNSKRWLLSGCAHNGILNILDRYREIFRSERERQLLPTANKQAPFLRSAKVPLPVFSQTHEKAEMKHTCAITVSFFFFLDIAVTLYKIKN